MAINKSENFRYFSLRWNNDTFYFTEFRNIHNGSYFVWKIHWENLSSTNRDQEFKFLTLHLGLNTFYILVSNTEKYFAKNSNSISISRLPLYKETNS
ncbi:hypothetical protein MXB_2519, partial [Myxobolus squamalis]